MNSTKAIQKVGSVASSATALGRSLKVFFRASLGRLTLGFSFSRLFIFFIAFFVRGLGLDCPAFL